VSPVLSPAWISVSSPLLERATMSQISSLPQPTQSVSRVLTADTFISLATGNDTDFFPRCLLRPNGYFDSTPGHQLSQFLKPDEFVKKVCSLHSVASMIA
jgi:hypothetical protein